MSKRNPIVVVSYHARQRWRQRGRGWTGLTEIDTVAISAWRLGLPAKNRGRRRQDGIRKLYAGYVFVFDWEIPNQKLVLLTVYSLTNV